MNYIYHITHQERVPGYMGALVDSGANGGMARYDTQVLSTVPHGHVDITGVGGSVMERYLWYSVPLALIPSTKGALYLSCHNMPTNPICRQFIRSHNLSISEVLSMTPLSLLVGIKWLLLMKGIPYLSMSVMDFTIWTCLQPLTPNKSISHMSS